MLQLLESIEVMLQNGNSIHPNSVIRGAIQTAIGMEVNVTNVNDKCDNKQTAVEFLEEQIRYYISNDDRLYDMFKQAKAMFEEQVTLSHINGQSEFDKGAYGEHNEKLANEYYNQNYK